MQYKGDDLDLRVPNVRPPREGYVDFESTTSNGRWSQSPGYSRDPLWVDETVLACCNYAFDIAQANGSAEVGLEHLVNALTRVDGAARVLEARGVREAQLRRESAALIASEPVAGFERVAPRRSADLEEALRRASENGSRRGSAATVDDLLWVILHSNRDVPAVQLLRRLTPDWQRLEWSWARPREYAGPQPELMRSAPTFAEPMRSTPSPVSFATDPVGNRIGYIEDSLRALHAELAGERKALSDLIRDTQRDVVAQRGDSASLRSDISQRLEMLERGLQVRPDSSRLTVQLGDRIQMLEKAVQNGLGEGARNWAALGQRLQAIESAITAPDSDAGINKALIERIDGLESYFAAGGGDSGSGQAILDRVASLEEMIEGRLSQSQRVWSGFTERLQAVERLVEAGTGEGGRNWTVISEKLAALDTFVRNRPAAGPGSGDLADRFIELERVVKAGFGDHVRSASQVTERLAALEKLADGATMGEGQGEAVLVLDDRMQSIERMLQDQLGKAGGGIATPELDQRLAAFEQRNAVRSDQLLQIVRDMVGRLGAIEQKFAAVAGGTSETAQGREREIAEIHEAIVRLSENQHTLASAISDWRHESQNDFGALNAQFERLAEPARVSVPVSTVSTSGMPNVARPQTADIRVPDVQPEARRAGLDDTGETGVEVRPRGHGFWWWLFGTDSITRANREVELRWQRMHARIKEARDRRRGERV